MEGTEDPQNVVLDNLFLTGFKPLECKTKLHNIRDYVGIPLVGPKKDDNRDSYNSVEGVRCLDANACENHQPLHIHLPDLSVKAEWKKLPYLGAYSILKFDYGTEKQMEFDINANISKETDTFTNSAEGNANFNFGVEDKTDIDSTQEPLLHPEIVQVVSLSEVSFEVLDSQKLEHTELPNATDSDIPVETEAVVNDQINRLLKYRFMRNSTTEDKNTSSDNCDAENNVKTNLELMDEKNMCKQPCGNDETMKPNQTNTSNCDYEVYIDIDCIPVQEEKDVEQSDKLFSPDSAYGTEYIDQQCLDDVFDKDDKEVDGRFGADEEKSKSTYEKLDNSNNMDQKSKESEKKKTKKRQYEDINMKESDAILRGFEKKSIDRNKSLHENKKIRTKPKHDRNIAKRDNERKSKYNCKDKENIRSKRRRKNIRNEVSKENNSKSDKNSNEDFTDNSHIDLTKSNCTIIKRKEDKSPRNINNGLGDRSRLCKVLNKTENELDDTFTNEKDCCKTQSVTEENTKAKSKATDKHNENCDNESNSKIGMIEERNADEELYMEFSHDRESRKKCSSKDEMIFQKDQKDKKKNTVRENIPQTDSGEQNGGGISFVLEKQEKVRKKQAYSNGAQNTDIETQEFVSEFRDAIGPGETLNASEKAKEDVQKKSAEGMATISVKKVSETESTALRPTQESSKDSAENKTRTKKYSKSDEPPINYVREKTLKEAFKKYNNSVIENKHLLDGKGNGVSTTKSQIISSDSVACSENSLSKSNRNVYKTIKQVIEGDKSEKPKTKNYVRTNTDGTKRQCSSDTVKPHTESKFSEKLEKRKKRKLSDTLLIERAAKKRVLEWLENQVTENAYDKEPVNNMHKPSLSQMKFKIPKRVKDSEKSEELFSCSYCKHASFKSNDLLQSHISRHHGSKSDSEERKDKQNHRMSCPDQIAKDSRRSLEKHRHSYSKSDNNSNSEQDKRRQGPEVDRKQSFDNKSNKSNDEIHKKEHKTPKSPSLKHCGRERLKHSSFEKVVGSRNGLHLSEQKQQSRSNGKHKDIHANSDCARESHCKAEEISNKEIQLSKGVSDNKTNTCPVESFPDLDNEGNRLHDMKKCQSDSIQNVNDVNKPEHCNIGKSVQEFTDSNTNISDTYATSIPEHKLLMDDLQTSESVELNSKVETGGLKRKNIDTAETEKEKNKTDFEQKDKKCCMIKEQNRNPIKSILIQKEVNKETVTEKEVNNETKVKKVVKSKTKAEYEVNNETKTKIGVKSEIKAEKEVSNRVKAEVKQSKDAYMEKNSERSVRKFHKCELCEKAYFSDKTKLLQHKHERHSKGNDENFLNDSCGFNAANTQHSSDMSIHNASDKNLKSDKSMSSSSSQSLINLLSIDVQPSAKIRNLVKQNFVEENAKSATTERCIFCNKVFFIGSIQRHIRIAHQGETKQISTETNTTNSSRVIANNRTEFKGASEVNSMNVHAQTNRLEKSYNLHSSTNSLKDPKQRWFFQRNAPHQNDFREGLNNDLMHMMETVTAIQKCPFTEHIERFPWQCRKCKQRFSNKNLLKRHNQTVGHFKPF